MKKLVLLCVTTALIVIAVPVLASSHGAMPPQMSFKDQVIWELQHYAMHMQLTWDAICMMFAVSFALGWEMLNSQTLCAPQGDLTAHLFDTAMHSLGTFGSLCVLAVWVGVEATIRIRRYIGNSLRQRRRTLA